MTERNCEVEGPSFLFRWIWTGQLISNLGTQTSLYGIGLWLFGQSGQLLDFGLVAAVVQLARLLALPLLIRFFVTWPPGRLMLLCHSTGAVCTALLTLMLAGRSNVTLPPLAWILMVQGLAAVAEGVLVVRLSSLIPLLISEEGRLERASGLFAVVDGLVIVIAPFMGAWLVASAGLVGVLMLDGITFAAAFLTVVVAPWQEEGDRLRLAVFPEQKPWVPKTTLQRGIKLWQRSLLARSALVLTGVTSFVYAALEVLFPAWVAVAYAPERMGVALLANGCGYLLGFAAWRWKLGILRQHALLGTLIIQALILMGASLEVFAHLDGIWLGAVMAFSCGLPVVMAALYQDWVELAPREALPRYFSLRYGCEWSMRLLAFLMVPLWVDRFLQPALSCPLWPEWLLEVLGTGPGRVMAIAMGGMGWLLIIGLGLRAFWMRERWQNWVGMRS